jgi:hypothetical protein
MAMIALMMEAVITSEMLVFFEPTWRYIPEGYNLHTCFHENLKSHNLIYVCELLL